MNHAIPAPVASVDLLALRADLRRVLGGLIGLGGAAVVAGALLDPAGFWPAYLVSATMVLTLGLSGPVLVSMTFLTKAGWAVVLRRVPEAMTGALLWGAAVFLAVPLGAHHIYAWSHDGAHGLAGAKAVWLSTPFFTLRTLVYLVVWIGLGLALVRRSRLQDLDGRIEHTRAAIRLSALFLVVFATTFNLASFDWFMSIEPHWYSTVYGVYHFSGLVLAGTAMATVLVIVLRRAGPLAEFVRADHLQDLGKLLFAFSSFWIYIWFSQYMLIWYTNIPEEAAHFAARFHGGWEAVFWANPLLNWAVPFLLLLPRAAKRSEAALLRVAAVVLVGRWLDVYLAIMPTFRSEPLLGPWEIALGVAAPAVFVAAFLRAFARANAIPIRDPLLEESMRFHQ